MATSNIYPDVPYQNMNLDFILSNCNEPTYNFCRWNSNTLNTPYKDGLTSYTTGWLISTKTGSDTFNRQICICDGEGQIFIRGIRGTGTSWTGWSSIYYKSTPTASTNLNNELYTGEVSYNDSTSNRPSTSGNDGYGICKILSTNIPDNTGGGWVHQIAFANSGKIYTRRRINSGNSFSAWSVIYGGGN